MGQTLNKVSYQGILHLHFWNDAIKTFIFELCQGVTSMLVKIKKTSWKDITETFWLLNQTCNTLSCITTEESTEICFWNIQSEK